MVHVIFCIPATARCQVVAYSAWMYLHVMDANHPMSLRKTLTAGYEIMHNQKYYRTGCSEHPSSTRISLINLPGRCNDGDWLPCQYHVSRHESRQFCACPPLKPYKYHSTNALAQIPHAPRRLSFARKHYKVISISDKSGPSSTGSACCRGEASQTEGTCEVMWKAV